MPVLVSIGLNLCILWFLIVLFTNSTNAEQCYREATIVVFGVMIVGLVFTFVLGHLAVLPQLVALYWLVDWACGAERRVTLKICGWYLALSLATAGGDPFPGDATVRWSQ